MNAAVAARSLFNESPTSLKYRPRFITFDRRSCHISATLRKISPEIPAAAKHVRTFTAGAGPGRAAAPAHAGGIFFGRCLALRRPVDVAGAAFIAVFFGAFADAGSVKRDAHLCSKRRWR
jgi:pimeloyl-ACP methyl ester carboxylesterase